MYFSAQSRLSNFIIIYSVVSLQTQTKRGLNKKIKHCHCLPRKNSRFLNVSEILSQKVHICYAKKYKQKKNISHLRVQHKAAPCALIPYQKKQNGSLQKQM